MHCERYEVVVVGAGSAGAAFLKYLDKELREKTILIEKENFPKDDTRKAELVEETIEILKRDWKNIPDEIFTQPKFLDIYYVDFDNGVKIYQKRSLWNINREKFNFWLFKEAKVNYFLNGNVIEITKKENKYLLKIKSKNYFKKVEANYLIGADGALSTVREFLGCKMKYGIGIQEWIDFKFSEKFMYFIYDSKISKYYSWAIPDNNFTVAGTAILPEEKDNLKLLKDKLKKYFHISGKVVKRGNDIAVRSSPESIFLGKENIFLVGEAAGLISPSTAEGISFALRSGKYCAEALNEGGGVEGYKEKCKPLIDEIKEKYQKLKILQDPEKRLKLWEKMGEVEKL